MVEAKEQGYAEIERQVQSAEYIADLTNELAELARRSGLDMLAYLLDIASLEAKTTAKRVPSSEAKNEASPIVPVS